MTGAHQLAVGDAYCLPTMTPRVAVTIRRNVPATAEEGVPAPAGSFCADVLGATYIYRDNRHTYGGFNSLVPLQREQLGIQPSTPLGHTAVTEYRGNPSRLRLRSLPSTEFVPSQASELQLCVSTCTRKIPNLLEQPLTNTPRRHRLADGPISLLYPPSSSFSLISAASVMCNSLTALSSAPSRPSV